MAKKLEWGEESDRSVSQDRGERQPALRDVSKTDFEHLTVVDALRQLGVDPRAGLSDAEANERLAQYGPNALEEKKKSAWAMFGKFLWGPMPWMIEAAAVMSILVNDWVDFSIIMVLLLFNAVLGFWHEREATNALDALK